MADRLFQRLGALAGRAGHLTDHGADAVGGEDFEQQHMRDAPIKDMSGADAGIDRIEAGLDFRNDAARDGAVAKQHIGILRRQ